MKQRKMKNNSQEWYDGEVAEKIAIRDKLFKKIKKSKLNVDKDLFKEARNNVESLIKNKKNTFFENKLKENIGKPKELWKTLNDLGLAKKGSSSGKQNILYLILLKLLTYLKHFSLTSPKIFYLSCQLHQIDSIKTQF